MNIVKTLTTLSLAFALAAVALAGADIVLWPSDSEAAGRSWSPNKRTPPFNPCHPNPRSCRGGSI